MLPGAAITREAGNYALDRAQNRRLAGILEKHLVQALAVEAAAEIEVVFAGRAAGKRNLRDIGARAAVRAAAHAERDRFIEQIVLGEDLLDLPDQLREI